MEMQGHGSVQGRRAPSFRLPDQQGRILELGVLLKDGPVMLVFYPGDFTPVCTKQLCNYRDHMGRFAHFGVQVVGISGNSVQSHGEFAEQYEFGFPLLSDPDRTAAKAYGCTSLLMLGGVSRAVCIVNRKGILLYRYVEPTSLTRRRADELVQVLEDLQSNALL